ncbi:MAG: Do family serine endopeptidase [Alphaproteobacteria bacterium]|nr:Do family serine endopeptidase [Alphaproteobacteria bacterium]
MIRPSLVYRAVAALCFVAVVVETSPVPAQAADTALPDFADLTERLLPSVVSIATVMRTASGHRSRPQFPLPPDAFPPNSPFRDFFRDFFERGPQQAPSPRPPRSFGGGSGFLIEADGYIVTNHHVIEDAAEIAVTLHDGKTYTAEVKGSDPKTDLALLKIEPDEPLPVVEWGDSDTARMGNWVFAIGNPFGLSSTLTVGVISALARDIRSGPFDSYIQTDAAINRGNSGGPLFNLDGRVIGVNTSIYSPPGGAGGSVGIGFAVPSSIAKTVVAQIRELGRTRRGWLGVQIQGVGEDIAESLRLEKPAGALVAVVFPDSPAANAGVQPGDVLLKFDGDDIPTVRDLPRMVAGAEVGSEIEIDLWRDGRMETVRVKLGELEAVEAALASAEEVEPATGETLGLTLATLTPDERARLTIDEDVLGVVVTGVSPDSDAASKGMQVGDVIVEVGRKPVRTPAAAVDEVDRLQQEGQTSILLLVNREGSNLFVALRSADS